MNGYDIALGIIIGAYITYTQIKIMLLEKTIKEIDDAFPTPEELAREVIKVKLPMSDLPPEMMANIKKDAEALKELKELSEGLKSMNTTGDGPMPKTKDTSKMSYVG